MVTKHSVSSTTDGQLRRPHKVTPFFANFANVSLPVRTLTYAFVIYFASQANSLAQDKINFLFSNLSFEIERDLVPEQPSPGSRRYSQDEWRRVTEYKMEPGQGVFFRLPIGDAIPQASSCQKMGLAELAYQTLPRRGAPDDRRRYDMMTAITTDFPGISRLVDPAGKTPQFREIYQFEVDDLRDYWGDKQTFANREVTVLLYVQIARNALFSATPRADGCFFQDGVTLTRHFRRFVLDRFKGNL